MRETKKLTRDITQLTNAIVTERPGWYFDPYQAKQRLLKHFGTATLEGFGIGDGEDGLIPPAGAIIEYLNETQKTTLGHIQSLSDRLEHLLGVRVQGIRAIERQHSVVVALFVANVG